MGLQGPHHNFKWLGVLLLLNCNIQERKRCMYTIQKLCRAIRAWCERPRLVRNLTVERAPHFVAGYGNFP